MIHNNIYIIHINMNIYNLLTNIDMIHFGKESMAKVYLSNKNFYNKIFFYEFFINFLLI